MCVLKINTNFYVCFYFLLVKSVTKVVTIPTQNFSSCNCVLLQSCHAFNVFIDKSSDETHIKTVIQNSVCFFDGFNIFVCCPDKIQSKRNAKEKPKLNYLDELTGLNCPPSFGNEHNYDEYLKTHEIEPKSFNHHSHTSNSDCNYNHYDHTADVDCDGFGNCGGYEDRNDNKSPPYHQTEHHHQGHVPFFPHTHTNHDYPMEITTPKPGKKKSNSCGISTSIGENSVEVYPWIIRLAYLNTTSRTIRYRCMGTIISDRHILTAAHCVDQLVTDLRLIYVRIGDDTNFEDYQILETIVHPNYNEPLFNNDVAILKLAITSQNKGSLVQICLPQNNSNTLSGDTGIVAGWTSSGISNIKSSTIRYINLPIMNNTECAIRYAKYSENFEVSIIITPTEFCAKAQAMNDVCEGDSGGPFMERSKTGRHTLLGIVAFGPKTNCGQSNLPGVYMRVSSYVDWITSNMQ